MSDVAASSRLPETVEEFLLWPGDGRAKHYELVDGVVRAMAPGSTTHATIQANLAFLITSSLRNSGSRCRLLVTPGIVPRLNARENFRVPDLGVTCTPDTAQELAMPDPLLLVEVLSPSNRAKTWTNVWAYSTIPGLQEILVVHSTRIDVQLMRRAADGSWPQAHLSHGIDDALSLQSIAMTCPVADLYAGTHLARGEDGPV